MISTEKIQQFITEELLEQQQSIAVDEDLLLSGLLDSMAIAQLVAFIETKASVSIPPQDLRIENFRTVSIIVAYLTRHYPGDAVSS